MTSVHEQSDDEFSAWKPLFIFSAIVGLLLFEWAWYRLRRFRNPNKDLDALYPAYQRSDALEWRKWKLYPGAVTLLIPRLIITVLAVVSLYIWLTICLWGHPKGEPITGCRKTILRNVYKVHTHFVSLGFFHQLRWVQVPPEQVGFYEEYLGTVDEQNFCQQVATTDPRVPKRGPGKASAIVCNHTGFLEIFNLITSPLHPGFTPRKQLQEVPVINTLTEALGSLFIERGGTLEERNQIVEAIIDR